MSTSFTTLWIYLYGLMLLFVGGTSAVGAFIKDTGSVPCEDEGAPVLFEYAESYPCVKCTCKSGFVDCKLLEDCPAPEGCHNIIFPKPKNTCCEVCRACPYNNMTIKSGETVRDGEDPCITLQCHGGVLTRSKQVCITPCKNPVHIPGKCCPVCPGCTHRGTTYASGPLFRDSRDPCMICECKNGNLECSKNACPQLNCPPNHFKQAAEGKCCPTCVGQRKLYQAGAQCLYHPTNGTLYSDGQEVAQGNSCQTCKCLQGTVVCEKKTCPRLRCSASKWKLPEGNECCPSCPLPKRKCRVENKKMKHGAMWYPDNCTQCKCIDGATRCWRDDCLSTIASCPQRTHELQYVAGQCCPKCVEISATCFVFGDPHYRTFDGVLYTFQGSCHYTLAQQCSSSKRTFSIQVKNAAWPDKTQYAYTNSVIINTQYVQVELKQHLQVFISKRKVKLPFIKLGQISILQRGYSLFVTTSLGVTVVWDGLSYVEVSVSQSYKNKMCGLCGNYNGISQDDFIGRHKTNYSTAVDFANSWQRDTMTCQRPSKPKVNLVPHMISCSNTDYETQTWIDAKCRVLKSYIVTSKCKTIEDIVLYHGQCIDKLCRCGDPKQCYCISARSLLKACSPAAEDYNFEHNIKTSCRV